jgi:uncharacterized protein (TIGR00251 family)
MIAASEKDGSLEFKVKVVPRASRTEIVGEHDGALRIRIAAPPVEGAANDELIRTLAKTFGLPKNAIQIASGRESRMKQVRVRGIQKKDLDRLATP